MEYPIKYIFRMTHIDNIGHILKAGIVHATSPLASSDFISIGDTSLIASRNTTRLENGKTIGDYIPFYFGYRTPMLYVIQHGYNNVPKQEAQDIIYIVLRIQSLIDAGLKWGFTDGHSRNNLTKFYEGIDLQHINEVLKPSDIFERQWSKNDDTDIKRRKEAEFLSETDVPAALIAGYVVYNEAAKNKLITAGIPEGQIVIRPNYYF